MTEPVHVDELLRRNRVPTGHDLGELASDAVASLRTLDQGEVTETVNVLHDDDVRVLARGDDLGNWYAFGVQELEQSRFPLQSVEPGKAEIGAPVAPDIIPLAVATVMNQPGRPPDSRPACRVKDTIFPPNLDPTHGKTSASVRMATSL